MKKFLNESFKKEFPPTRRSFLALAFPASTVSVEPTLQLKTLKVGLIARAAAIHRVDEVIVYKDRQETDRELELVVDLLEYLVLPPYLRKKYIPKKKTLKYAGILPPLKTPSHIKPSKLEVGEYREGYVYRVGKNFYVDVGLKLPLPVKGRVEEGVKIVKVLEKNSKRYAVPVDKKRIPYYWGFSIAWSESLSEVLSEDWNLKIATSRWGEDISRIHSKLKSLYWKSKRVLVAFGSPTEGLWEIAGREGISLDEAFDLIVNFIPDQGVETVRTEEAIQSVLEYFTLLEAETL